MFPNHFDSVLGPHFHRLRKARPLPGGLPRDRGRKFVPASCHRHPLMVFLGRDGASTIALGRRGPQTVRTFHAIPSRIRPSRDRSRCDRDHPVRIPVSYIHPVEGRPLSLWYYRDASRCNMAAIRSEDSDFAASSHGEVFHAAQSARSLASPKGRHILSSRRLIANLR